MADARPRGRVARVPGFAAVESDLDAACGAGGRGDRRGRAGAETAGRGRPGEPVVPGPAGGCEASGGSRRVPGPDVCSAAGPPGASRDPPYLARTCGVLGPETGLPTRGRFRAVTNHGACSDQNDHLLVKLSPESNMFPSLHGHVCLFHARPRRRPQPTGRVRVSAARRHTRCKSDTLAPRRDPCPTVRSRPGEHRGYRQAPTRPERYSPEFSPWVQRAATGGYFFRCASEIRKHPGHALAGPRLPGSLAFAPHGPAHHGRQPTAPGRMVPEPLQDSWDERDFHSTDPLCAATQESPSPDQDPEPVWFWLCQVGQWSIRRGVRAAHNLLLPSACQNPI